MLNKKSQRELAYLVIVDSIKPMDADRLECALIGGWNCVVGKGEFQPGDLAVYFEIDSKLPEVSPFVEMEFLKSKHFKIKSQKIRGVISQGLLVSPKTLGWEVYTDGDGTSYCHIDGKSCSVKDESRFLTEILGVTYSTPEDNKRKSNVDPYKVMQDRHKKLFRNPVVKKLMRYKFFRKIMLLFFGGKKKKNNKYLFPSWVKHSDQERVQNMPFLFPYNTDIFWETTKIDGTSSTFILEKLPFGKYRYTVCSRNVIQDSRDTPNFHSDKENVYWEASDKYKIKPFLESVLEQTGWKGVALQGEIAGCSLGGVKIQGDPHNFGELRFFGFDMYCKETVRVPVEDAVSFCESFGIPWVPITNKNFVLPDSCDELLNHATGPCEAPGSSGLREGYVYRKVGDPWFSFKAVSAEYLLKNS